MSPNRILVWRAVVDDEAVANLNFESGGESNPLEMERRPIEPCIIVISFERYYPLGKIGV